MGEATEQSASAVASTIRTAVIGAAAGVIAALVTSAFTYASRDRELNIKLIEIGIGILRDDPEKSGTSGAREWAIAIIQRTSGQNFSSDAKTQLLKRPLGYKGFEVPAPEWFEVPAPETTSAPRPSR